MPKQSQTKEERAAAHCVSVKKSYLKNHGKNKEKGRVRMAETRERLKNLLQARKESTSTAAPDSNSGNDEAVLSDNGSVGMADTHGRFSSPAIGSVSAEETEIPDSRPNTSANRTRFSSHIAGSISGEESVHGTDRNFLNRSATKEQDLGQSRPPIPGLTYVDLPECMIFYQSIFEQMSYDLDEEIEIAEELLGVEGFQEMVEDDTRRMEEFRKSGARMFSFRE